MTGNLFALIDRVLHECDARRMPPLLDVADLLHASVLADDTVPAATAEFSESAVVIR